MIAARQAAGASEADKQARSRAAALFPNLTPEQAYVKYLKTYEPPPSGPRPASQPLDFQMGMIAQMRDTGIPRKPTPGELKALDYYEKRQKRGSILDALLERYMVDQTAE
jgi:hypothetical protein